MNRKTIIAVLFSAAFLMIGTAARADLSAPFSILDIPFSYNDQKLFDKADNPENINSGPGFKISGPKSKSKAVLLSVLVPGAGQYYLGEKARGEIFMGVELLTWVGFAVFQHSASWKKDAYIDYAVLHAGIDPDGKDDEFYKNVSFYDSREQYNESGRIIDPRGPYYDVNASTYWYWDETDNRNVFRDLRNDSKSDYRKTTFLLGVAVLNRVLSGIDTFRIARKLQGRSGSLSVVDETKIKFDFDANPFGSNPKVGFTLSKKF